MSRSATFVRRCQCCALVVVLAALTACASGARREGASAPETSDGKATDLVVLEQRAEEAYGEGRLLDAEQLYRTILRRVPNSAHAWMRLGNVHLRSNQLDAAVYAYRQCLQHSPDDARCWNNLALGYVKMAVETIEQSEERSIDAESRERLAAFRRRLIESTQTTGTEGRLQ